MTREFHRYQTLHPDRSRLPHAHRCANGIGSGFLVSSSTGSFLISAAHVLDPLQSGTKLFFYAGPGCHSLRPRHEPSAGKGQKNRPIRCRRAATPRTAVASRTCGQQDSASPKCA